jgi:hypothetical protein
MDFTKDKVFESWVISNTTGTPEQRKIANIYLSEFQVR